MTERAGQREVVALVDFLAKLIQSGAYARHECPPPWEADPYRLVSLWEIMIRLRIPYLIGVIQLLQRLSSYARENSEELNDKEVEMIGDLAEMAKNMTDMLSMPCSSAAIERLVALGDTTPRGSIGKMKTIVDDLRSRMIDELEDKCFFYVPSQRAQMLNAAPFGTEVLDRFPSAAYDIREAVRCFAFARWSACVFHLTRGLEVFLAALCKAVGVAPAENWNKLLDQVDSAIKKGLTPPDPRPADWKDLEQFYSAASGHFRNIKNAWRNPVSHSGFSYDEEEALAVLRSTELFMRHLAKRLSE